MDKTEKERLLALIKAKKEGNPKIYQGRRDIYAANGEARKGLKKYKKGGLFDK